MSTPRFTAGQMVSVARSKHIPAAEGRYQIIAALPNSGPGATRYRIKGELEKYERVVDEMHLADA